jgi:aryl-alcohol dehydrogenase-like predicted oxidoreductase
VQAAAAATAAATLLPVSLRAQQSPPIRRAIPSTREEIPIVGLGTWITFNLVQVHNLLAWKPHLQTLFQMKAAGAVRYVGITTSEGRRHDLLEQIMRNEPIDFVQFSYNVVDREAEARLLPLASERGIAVIVNRPFRQGALTDRLKREVLPEWAREFGVSSWAQLILKFILSHPAVTVAIPATTRVDHVRENLKAAAGPMPDPAMRERISAHVKAL